MEKQFQNEDLLYYLLLNQYTKRRSLLYADKKDAIISSMKYSANDFYNPLEYILTLLAIKSLNDENAKESYKNKKDKGKKIKNMK